MLNFKQNIRFDQSLLKISQLKSSQLPHTTKDLLFIPISLISSYLRCLYDNAFWPMISNQRPYCQEINVKSYGLHTLIINQSFFLPSKKVWSHFFHIVPNSSREQMHKIHFSRISKSMQRLKNDRQMALKLFESSRRCLLIALRLITSLDALIWLSVSILFC